MRRASAHALVADVHQPLLDDDAAHHVFRVLRIGDGASITVTDGAGSWRVCRAAGGNVRPDGDVVVEAGRHVPITVAFAVPKMDRPEWIVQKLTEVGVDRIVVLHEGQVVESGRHDELLAARGRYAGLWELQRREADEQAEATEVAE